MSPVDEKELMRMIEYHEDVLTEGYVVQTVQDEQYSFAYTIGRFVKGMPELIVNSRDLDFAKKYIDYVCQHWNDDSMEASLPRGYCKSMELEVTDELIEGYITESYQYFTFMSQFPVHSSHPFKRSVRVLQLIYGDRAGRFPNDDDYDQRNSPQVMFAMKV
ncbi:DUF4262 domain-containing protein [Vibrio sp. PNB23_22_7]